MKLAARLVLILLLAAGVLHELGRYRAERALGATRAAVLRFQSGAAPASAGAVRRVEEAAEEISVRLPGDARPLILAGSARLLARDPERALRWYARALEHGERAEIDLNIGRAAMMQRDLAGAQRAFLRTGWLAPRLLDELPEAARVPLAGELERLTTALQAGASGAVPPSPDVR